MRRSFALQLAVCALLVGVTLLPQTTSGSGSWSYLLPVDHGIRNDRGGRGYFLAPRTHGRHNGLDFLAPIGTKVNAVCDGTARSGRRGAFGRFVQLVCRVPAQLTGGKPLWASVFYAHLHTTRLSSAWRSVRSGQPVGTVGKSGNAFSRRIMPHVHLEVAIHSSKRAALKDRHSGRDQRSSAAADRFFEQLNRRCTKPNAFKSPVPFRRARRADPYALLVCLQVHKPAFALPAQPLSPAATKWSRHYAARFDVDVGLRAGKSRKK